MIKKALMLSAAIAGAALFAGPKADADLSAIKTHFSQTSADFSQSKSNWRWVFYGDSITHGCAHTSGWRNFVEIFTEVIRWEKASLFDHVINSGNSGYSSTHLVRDGQFDWQVADLKPNVVLILIGANDIVLPDASLERFTENLRTLVKKTRDINAIPVLQTYNTMELLRNPVEKWQHDYVKRYNEFPSYNDAIRKVAQEFDVILVDHDKHWRTNAADATTLNFWLGDPLHPGARGHQEMAKLIVRTLGIAPASSASMSLAAGGQAPEPITQENTAEEMTAVDGVQWIINEDATGLNDTHKWSISTDYSSVKDGVLTLNMVGSKQGMHNYIDRGKLAEINGQAVLEMEMRMPKSNDGRANRFFLAFVPGNTKTVEPIYLIASNKISGTGGKAAIDIDPEKFFVLRIISDTATGLTKTYIDGVKIAEVTAKPVTKDGARLVFGKGSPSIGGTIEIRSLKIGKLK